MLPERRGYEELRGVHLIARRRYKRPCVTACRKVALALLPICFSTRKCPYCAEFFFVRDAVASARL